MDENLIAICVAAAGVGVVHTALGPDHYVPFIAMARVGKWSRSKTTVVTLACGVGHVLSSVLIAGVGAAIGAAVGSVEWIESIRGEVAAWLLIGFGLAYMVWGLRRAYRNRPHTHWHAHVDGTVHSHEHTHHGAHVHVHTSPGPASMTPWILFTIFLFGPCEALIPIVMYPAAKGQWLQMLPVVLSFTVATLATMLSIVLVADRAGHWLPIQRLQRFGHAFAGALVLACGAAIKFGL